MSVLVHGIVDHRIQDGDYIPDEIPAEMLQGHASVTMHQTGINVLLGTGREFERASADSPPEEGSWPRSISSELNAGAMSLMFSAQSCDTEPEVVMLMGPEGMAVYSNSNPGQGNGIVVFTRGSNGFDIIEGDVNLYSLAEARLRIGLPNHYGPEFAPETDEGVVP